MLHHPPLTSVAAQLLEQLNDAIARLTAEQYASECNLLSGQTIGKHVRHILELFEEWLNGQQIGKVNYDARQRQLVIETDAQEAQAFAHRINHQLQKVNEDKMITVVGSFALHAPEIVLQSSVMRELAYNIEHAIHHMAIIQIVIRHQYPHIQLPETFGIAFATRNHQSKHVHA